MAIKNIDKIYCVSLERRQDRREQVSIEFSKHGLDFNFFNAIDGHLLNKQAKIKPGHVGCVLSHLSIFKELRGSDGEFFMITEDDVVFHDDFINLYNSWILEVPKDWEILYFGGNHNGKPLNMVSPHVHRLEKTYTTHCYIIRKSALEVVIKEFETTEIFNMEVDVHLSRVQSIIPCYGFVPAIAWQREGFSDIEMKDVDYNFLKK